MLPLCLSSITFLAVQRICPLSTGAVLSLLASKQLVCMTVTPGDSRSLLARTCRLSATLMCLFALSLPAEWQGSLPCSRHQCAESQWTQCTGEQADQGLCNQLCTCSTGYAHKVSTWCSCWYRLKSHDNPSLGRTLTRMRLLFYLLYTCPPEQRVADHCCRVPQAKIACLDMNLQKARLQMGVQV